MKEAREMEMLEQWVAVYRGILTEVRGLVNQEMKVRSALEIGSGEGAMLKALAAEFPGAAIVALDPRVKPKVDVAHVEFLDKTAEQFMVDLRRMGGERRFDVITVATVDGVKLEASDFSKLLSNRGLLVEFGCTLNIKNGDKSLKRIDGDRIRQVRVWQKSDNTGSSE